MKLVAERSLVIIASSIFSYFLVFHLQDLYAKDGAKVIELLKLIVPVAGVLLGFILTALSILVAVLDKTLIANMVRTGHFRNFIRQAFFSSFLLFLLIILGFIILGIPNFWLKYGFSILFVLIVFTLYELFMTSRRFYNVIIVMSESVR